MSTPGILLQDQLRLIGTVLFDQLVDHFPHPGLALNEQRHALSVERVAASIDDDAGHQPQARVCSYIFTAVIASKETGNSALTRKRSTLCERRFAPAK